MQACMVVALTLAAAFPAATPVMARAAVPVPFPVIAARFPVPLEKSPCSLQEGLSPNILAQNNKMQNDRHRRDQIFFVSLLFSLLSPAEQGNAAIASPLCRLRTKARAGHIPRW